MTIHQLKFQQKLPISLIEAWDFLSSPNNLKTITPPHMGFEITNGVESGQIMFAGQIIVYHVNVMPFFRTEWVTEITHVKEHEYFIDEQRHGPYKMWHHLHHLSTIKNGTLMDDTIHYKLPFSKLGNIANQIFVKKQIQQIFDYRQSKLIELFGEY